MTWQTKKLGEVCEVIAGQSPEGKFYNKFGKGLPFYQGKREFTEKFIGKPTTWTTKTTKEALTGDILMSVRAPVGPINFAKEKICIGRGLAAIRAGKEINKDFLFNFFKNFESEIVGNAGAVFNSISKTQIEGIEIPVPSVAEQGRIVGKLDKVFGEVGRARENAERNLKNAKELFERYLQGAFANQGKPASAKSFGVAKWEEKKLGEVCEVIAGQSPEGKFYNKSGKGLPFYQGKKEFTKKFIGEPTTWTTKITKEAQEGDILMSVRAPVGPINFATEKICIGRGLAVIRASRDVDKDFLFYALYSKQKDITGNTGAVFASINKNAIGNLVLFLPPLPEQGDIVKKLDGLVGEVRKLEGIYKQKLADLEELKKSVLKSAFAGEL